jgi:hypothetical protein
MAPLADLIHAVFAKLFPRRVTHNPAGRHHRLPGRPQMVLAGTVVRTERAHRALRAECDRMASLLDGIRRGRSESVFYRAALRRSVVHVPARARQRFTAAAGHTRTAAREVAAVAARTARQVGARHRHVPGSTDVQHDLAARILAYAKQYEARRARGEQSTWQRMRTA